MVYKANYKEHTGWSFHGPMTGVPSKDPSTTNTMYTHTLQYT